MIIFNPHFKQRAFQQPFTQLINFPAKSNGRPQQKARSFLVFYFCPVLRYKKKTMLNKKSDFIDKSLSPVKLVNRCSDINKLKLIQ